jgi:hypothetical protein
MMRLQPLGSLVSDPSPSEVARVVEAWAGFLGRVDWQWFVTLTFRGNPHPESALKKVKVWCSKLSQHLFGRRWYRRSRGVRWVCAVERTRQGIVHCHLLVSADGLVTARRLSWKDEWERLGGGFARVEQPSSAPRAAAYCAKYICKGGELVLGGNWSREQQRSLPLAEVVPQRNHSGRSSERYGEARSGPRTGAGSASLPGNDPP